MSLVHLNQTEVISLRLSVPLTGVWTAEAEVDADAIERGPSTIAIAVEGAAPVVFAGTVIESGAFEGRARAFLVGGAGGLRRELPPRQYQIAPPKLIAAAILRETGERAGELAALDELLPMPRWVRSRSSGGAALTALCARVGVGWRVVRDGAVRVGREAWRPYAGAPFVLAEDGASGQAVAAQDAPDIEPGMTVGGRRIGRVVHRIDSGISRTFIHFERDQ
jgi:hypothetical protein